MTITLTPDIEDVLTEQAQRQGTEPEALALEGLRKLFTKTEGAAPPELIEPRDDWERLVASIGVDCGVSLTDEQVSRDVIYADHD